MMKLNFYMFDRPRMFIDMNLERYPYFASTDFKSYSFYSVGPKGKIKKGITYSKIQNEPAIYNLAFGDEDPATGSLNDLVVTSNDDRDVVWRQLLIR